MSPLLRDKVLVCLLMGTRKDDVWNRLQWALSETNATRLHVVHRPEDPESPYREIQDHVWNQLRISRNQRERFNWQRHEADLFNLQETLEKMVEVLALEREHEITVAATGGEPTGIILGTVCVLFGGKHTVHGMYVPNPDYGEELQLIPEWILGEPPIDDRTVRTLKIIEEHDPGLDELDGGLDKNALVAELEDAELIPEGLGKSAYRRVRTAYLEDLEDKGFVEVRKDRRDRRKHRIRITEEGSSALSVLEPMTQPPEDLGFIRGPMDQTRQENLQRFEGSPEDDE